jgi:hexosaminidase
VANTKLLRLAGFAPELGLAPVFAGYPELASGPGPYKVDPGGPDAVMDPTREETYKFIDKFIEEMAKLFPDDYFHIGGDEVT